MGIKTGPKRTNQDGTPDKRQRVTEENKKKHPKLKEHKHEKRRLTQSKQFLSRLLLIFLAHNALLRCEQRNTDATAYHLNHLNQRMVKMPRVANHS
ncbi:hypothetical protein D5E81_24885 [Vibrio parahaemolyticus]|nr:hypothetical protein D5E81_24885 [Vibrio parahaemolyticus]